MHVCVHAAVCKSYKDENRCKKGNSKWVRQEWMKAKCGGTQVGREIEKGGELHTASLLPFIEKSALLYTSKRQGAYIGGVLLSLS